MSFQQFHARPTVLKAIPSPALLELGDSDCDRFSKTSVRDQAALLLSICDIAKSEIKTCPSALSDEQDSPPEFPLLGDQHYKSVTPRKNSRRGLLPTPKTYPSGRIRTVSLDTPETGSRRTPSPLMSPPPLATVTPVTPIGGRSSHRSLRLSAKARQEHAREREDIIQVNPKRSKGKPLQGEVEEGVTVKKIYRRKFSWKNYPELEQFLIANREEYLRHSALNYTLQQKQYNNRLTERLLELATEHGYLFDEKEFGFVTVRDRIRCYYKSFVQSAKKRGILMGYAARKAGLLTENDLEKSANQAGRIITPY